MQAYNEYKNDRIGPALTSVMENSIKVWLHLCLSHARMHLAHTLDVRRLRKSKRTDAGKDFTATSRRRN